MTEFARTLLDGGFPPALKVFLSRSAEIAFILVLGVALTWAVRVLFNRLAQLAGKAEGKSRAFTSEDIRRVSTVLGVLQTIVLLLLWAVLAVTMLSHAGVNIAPILAGAGIMGVAVGFGAQHLVRDFITGLFILLENHVRLGDVVRINGVGGLIESITYRVIVLRDFEGIVHVFPHGQIEKLSNMTKEWSAAVVDVGVAYKEIPDRVIKVLQGVTEEMEADPDWSPRLLPPAEVLGVESFGPSEVLIRVRIKTRPLEQWNVKREFLRRVKNAFVQAGIEIPFPQRTLHAGDGGLAVRVLAPPPEGPLDSSPSDPKSAGRD